MHQRSGANDGRVDRSDRGLHRALGMDGLRPHGKSHAREAPPCRGSRHRSPDRPRRARETRSPSRSPNMPSALSEEVPSTATSPGLQHLRGDVQHPVVAGMRKNGHGRCRRPWRPDKSGACRYASKAHASHGLVNGGDAILRQRRDAGRVGALDLLHRNSRLSDHRNPHAPLMLDISARKLRRA